MRFVVCGEALIDLVPLPDPDPQGDRRPHFRTVWEAQSAGGPMNTAVALAQLDADVEFLGRFSTDVYANQLTRYLRDCRVGLDLAATVQDQSTSLAVVDLDDQGKASYVFHFANTANFGWVADDLPELDGEDWLHMASLATVVQPGAATLLDWAGATPARLSFDVNVRPSVIADPVHYWAAVEPWLAICAERDGLVKGSDDDIAFLGRGSGHAGTAVEVAQAWVRELGLHQMVVTLGPDGAASVRADGTVVTVPGHRVEVVDTVGAGDTFMAALLDALSRGADLADALRRGVAASAVVVTRAGAQPPTRAEVEQVLRAADGSAT